MSDKDKKKIVVNGLSGMRIVGAMSMPVLFSTGNIPLIIGVLAGLFLTDFVDGKLARKWDVQTTGGALLDPLGDKVLVLAVILSLLGTQNYMLVPLFMELGISAINIERTLHNECVKSNMFGKVKTWFLSITLVLGAINVLNPEILNLVVSKLGIDYSPSDIVKRASELTVAMQTLTAASYIQDSVSQKDVRSERIVELKNARDILVRLFDEEKSREDRDKSLIDIIKKDEIEEKHLKF